MRTLDWQTPAGFYSSGWGLIPFSLSRRALELIEVRQVNYLVERLPWATGTQSAWPGYLSLEGKSPLALLARQGTRVEFPWIFDHPVSLNMKCGVAPDAYTDGDPAVFEFEVRQRDSGGKVLSQSLWTLRPGVRKTDRAWQDVQVSLQPGAQGKVELQFRGTSNNPAAVGAFAETTLRSTQ